MQSTDELTIHGMDPTWDLTVRFEWRSEDPWAVHVLFMSYHGDHGVVPHVNSMEALNWALHHEGAPLKHEGLMHFSYDVDFTIWFLMEDMQYTPYTVDPDEMHKLIEFVNQVNIIAAKRDMWGTTHRELDLAIHHILMKGV
jgi:hypothetical protein